MNELATTTTDIEVVAETPEEMKQANAALIKWCDRKIASLTADYAELKAADDHTVALKWKASTHKRHMELASKRIAFYGKIKLAFQEGFWYRSGFSRMTVFAIRTDKRKPLKLMSTRHWDQPSQNAPGLDAGEGDHKNPAPVFFQRDVTSEDEKAKGKKTIEYFAEEWDLLDFPINMAKPRVMEATTRNDAKTLRRFSGLARLSPKAGSANCRAHQRSRSPGWGEPRCVSFIIAWLLDTASL